MYTTNKSGQNHIQKTTLGWKLLVQPKNGNGQQIPLKDLKESNPAEVSEFASKIGIVSEPSFVWLVPFNLSKRYKITAALISRTKRVSHKYGVQLPSTVQ